jgi:hypothetical protein
MLSFAAFVVWTAGDLRGQAPAQKPRVEEEEDTPKPKAKSDKKQRAEEEEEGSPKKPKRNIRPEDEEDPKAKPEAGRPGANDELAKLADQATQPAIKTLYRSLAVPYDLVLFKRSTLTSSGERVQRVEKIVPSPFYLGDDPDRFLRDHRLLCEPYSEDWKLDKKYSFAPLPGSLQYIRPYEEIAQDKVRQFLRDDKAPENSDSGIPPYYEKLVAAKNVLSSVLRWHESAKSTGGRSYERNSEDWKKVVEKLHKQLLEEVLLKQMEELARNQEWEKVLELAHSLARTYKDDRERIFRPVADMIQRALKGPIASEERKQEALKRLRDLERDFPDNAALQPLSDALCIEAQNRLDRARELAKEK